MSIPVRTYAVFYPEARRPGLLKDVGQLPWHLSRRGGWKTNLVTHPNSPSYDTVLTDERFSIQLMPPSRHLVGVSLGGLAWIWRNARSLDVAQLFHLRFQTFVYAAALRLRNRNVVLYLKTDLDSQQFAAKRPARYARGTLAGALRRTAFAFFLDHLAPIGMRLFDLASGETRASTIWLRSQFPTMADRFFRLPNGLAPLPEPGPSHESREKWILTVGRLGTWQKNNEMLVDAASRVALGDWKIVFCGPVEPGFREYAESRLGASAVFTGPVEDRERLYDIYRNARCFCLPSRFESFAFVLLEAFACGNYIVSTDVGVAADLLRDERDGRIISNESSLSQALEDVVGNDLTSAARIADRHAEVEQSYDWVVIAAQLERRLETILESRSRISRAS